MKFNLDADNRFWMPIMIPMICGLLVWAFNTNAEFGRREVRLKDLEDRNDRVVNALIRLEKKIDDLKDLLIIRK